MLRIKDNVDLKELEKFYFKPNGRIYSKYRDSYTFDFAKITIFVHNREIVLKNKNGIVVKRVAGWHKEQLDALIQAGLVEKVEEV